MDNDKLNNETDDLFRKGLENLSEKHPSGQEWLKMKSRLEKEGLIHGKTKRRWFIMLLLLTIMCLVAGSLYFINENSLPVKNISLKSNPSEIIKNETHDNPQQKTTAAPKQSVDNNKEIEKTTTAEINNEDKSNASIKEPVLAEHQRSKRTATSSGKMEASKLNKTMTANASAKGESDERKFPSTRTKGNETSTDTDETSRESQSSATPGNNEKQADTLNETKNQEAAAANENKNNDHTIVDTNAINNKSALSQRDSSKTANDVTPVVPVIEKGKGPKRSKFHIGGLFSLDFNHYLIKENNAVPANEANYVYSSDSIKGISSLAQFTVGITAGYMINDHFEIEGGASYSKKKEVRTNVATPAQTTDSAQQAYSEYIYNYNAEYLEFSGKIKYYYPLGSKKWLYAGAGGIASFNFPENQNNLSYYTHITYSDSVWVRSDKVILQPASATFSALFVAGFETELNNKWSFFIEPEYKYAFNPVIKHPTFDYIPVNHYWRTFSIGFGLNYNF